MSRQEYIINWEPPSQQQQFGNQWKHSCVS